MRVLLLFVGIFANLAAGAAVFAHFMVSNSEGYTVSDWENEIRLAKEARIDGFALNMAYGEATNKDSLPLAFTAAANLGGFRHIFSFDYAGNGSWPKADVINLIKTYGTKDTYFTHEGTNKPLVSTFEGSKSASDWNSIKIETNCFFMPSFSSLGAKKAMDTGVVDGLFSWAGDSLWFDRWTHVHYLKPQYVQIISWNDFGECHHIGPLPTRESAYTAFTASKGDSPFNYALGMPHDGWRLFLPWVIDRYKTGTSSVTREGLSVWFRPHPAAACTTGGTTGNTASQLQTTYVPSALAQDRVFYSALLTSTAIVTVTIGGVAQTATWTVVPDGGIGLYHGSASFGGATGVVVVTISRSSSIIARVTGRAITTTCTNGVQNWNAWVGSQTAASPATAGTPPRTISQQQCVAGTGDAAHAALCSHACKNGYCPDSCTCTQLGKPPVPTYLGKHACPIAGRDSTFGGLCSFSADTGFLSTVDCVERPVGTVCNPPLPATPAVPACVAGMGVRKFANLCGFTCQYNFCPPEVCSCTRIADSAPAAPQAVGTASYRSTMNDEDYGLCGWACNRGFCDRDACQYPEYGQILKEIGDDVAVNPTYAAMKLTAMEQQNSIYMIAFWSTCAAKLECGAGYNMVTTGHGKVFNAEKGSYDLNGCHGGGNGFNRALCVESDVILDGCDWYGKPKNCGQSCPVGHMLLAQNTHIGGAKTGCKANHFSSYCCSSIRPTRINYCPVPMWDRSFIGHVGGARARDAITERSDDQIEVLGTEKECKRRDTTIIDIEAGNNRIALGAFAGFPGYWMSNRVSGPRWVPAMNRPITNSAVFSCTTTVTLHSFTTTVSSPIATGTCDGGLYPNACHHYRSVISRASGLYDTLYCPWVTKNRRDAPSLWNSQHNSVWRTWISSIPASLQGTGSWNSCQRDEYPPFAFMELVGGYTQWMRVLPRWENYYGGREWAGRVNCEISSTVVTQGGGITSNTCYENVDTSYTREAFTMRFINMQAGDLVNVNPCLPTMITNDGGFALFTHDDWYMDNALSQHKPQEYALRTIPSSLLGANVWPPPNRANLKRSAEETNVDDIHRQLIHHGKHHHHPIHRLNFNPDHVAVDTGNSSRKATPDELFRELGLIRCRSLKCIEEQKAVGALADKSEGVLTATLATVTSATTTIEPGQGTRATDSIPKNTGLAGN